MQPNISWEPPEPRTGFAGMWDRFMGPGTTDAESWLQLFGSLVLIGLIVAVWLSEGEALGWSVLQLGVCFILLVDMAGGVVTNATSSTKRWYHRSSATMRDHMGFIVLHVLHPTLLMLLFDAYDIAFVVITFGFLLITSYTLFTIPLYLQRPTAFLFYAVALLMSLYLFEHPVGLEWFLPFYYLKLILAHAVKEAPFRPLNES